MSENPGEGASSVCPETRDRKRNLHEGDFHKVGEEEAGQPRPPPCICVWAGCRQARSSCGRRVERGFRGKRRLWGVGVHVHSRGTTPHPRAARGPDTRGCRAGGAKRGLPAGSSKLKAGRDRQSGANTSAWPAEAWGRESSSEGGRWNPESEHFRKPTCSVSRPIGFAQTFVSVRTCARLHPLRLPSTPTPPLRGRSRPI